MFKLIARTFLGFTLIFSMLSAAIPLHHILHEHHFVKLDECSLNTCKNHIKSHTDHCHTHSDAIFIADLPFQPEISDLHQPFIKLESYFKKDNYFQFFFLTKNKAPPFLITT